MAIDLNLGAAFESDVNVPVGPWKSSALHVTQNTGDLVKISDVLSPLDKSASAKMTTTRIANVYTTLAKGAIPIGNQSLNTSGVSLFTELVVTGSEVVNSVDILLPMVARIELRLPNYGGLTNADVRKLLNAAYALHQTDAGVDRFTDMMRGVLSPVCC